MRGKCFGQIKPAIRRLAGSNASRRLTAGDCPLVLRKEKRMAILLEIFHPDHHGLGL